MYDTFALDSTIVTEFDLVCENGNKVILIHGLFVFGQLFGSLLGAPAGNFFRRVFCKERLVNFEGALTRTTYNEGSVNLVLYPKRPGSKLPPKRAPTLAVPGKIF